MGDDDYQTQLVNRHERFSLLHQQQKTLRVLEEIEKELYQEFLKAKIKVKQIFSELQIPQPWEYAFIMMMKTLKRNPKADVWACSFAREYWDDLMIRVPCHLTNNIKYVKRVECNQGVGKCCSFCKQREFIICQEIWIPNGYVLLICEDCVEFVKGLIDFLTVLFECVEEFKEDDRDLIGFQYEKVMDSYLKLKLNRTEERGSVEF